MTAPLKIRSLALPGLEIGADGEGVKLSGVITMRDPSADVTPYLREVHAAIVAAGRREVEVDLTDLRFMNSSSIRSLVDWVEWVRKEPSDKQYVIVFVSNPDVTWQTTTLAAIRALSDAHVRVLKRTAAVASP